MSSFIERLAKKVTKVKVEVRGLIRAGVIKPPDNYNEPLIIIAIGAGITIFKGLLQERQEQKTQSSVGEVHVYCGCRRKDSPFVDDVNDWRAKGIVDRLEIALSQEGSPKLHIQDILKTSRNEINRMVKEKNATIMVCANLPVEQKIREALIDCFSDIEQDPNSLFELLKSNKRYMKQLWNY